MSGKKCFMAPVDCANCISMLRNDKCDKKSTSSCSCPRCMNLELRRCTGCYLVAYCSTLCQREHWSGPANHKKWCKILSGRKVLDRVNHQVGNCFSCTPDKNGQRCPSIDFRKRFIVTFMTIFGYHMDTDCECRTPNREAEEYYSREEKDYPVQFPFQLGDNTGVFMGWIDEYIYNMTKLFMKIFETVNCGNMLLFRVAGNDVYEYLEKMRARYWGYVMTERSRHVSEIHFAQEALDSLPKFGPWSGEAFTQMNNAMIERSENERTVWEQFLASISEFFKRLRKVKYYCLNVENISERKREKYEGFLLLHSLQTGEDRQELHFRPDSSFPLMTVLPAGVSCAACQVSLAGQEAQHQLQHPTLPWLADYDQEDLVLLRFPGRPVIHDKSPGKGLIATCGVSSCISLGLAHQNKRLMEEAKLLLPFLSEAQLCSGCLRYSVRTHRCSACLTARYCSSECLAGDWARHQAACLASREENRPTLPTSRLEGDLNNFLYRSDPLLYLSYKLTQEVKSPRALQNVLLQEWCSQDLMDSWLRSRR